MIRGAEAAEHGAAEYRLDEWVTMKLPNLPPDEGMNELKRRVSRFILAVNAPELPELYRTGLREVTVSWPTDAEHFNKIVFTDEPYHETVMHSPNSSWEEYTYSEKYSPSHVRELIDMIAMVKS